MADFTAKMRMKWCSLKKCHGPNDSYTGEADLLSKRSSLSQVEWAKAKSTMEEAATYELDKNQQNHRQLLKEYINLRI
jgi:hypothetical protein